MFLSLSSPRAYRRRAVSAEEGPEGRRRFFENVGKCSDCGGAINRDGREFSSRHSRNFGEQLDGKQGVAAEIEKVVVDANPWTQQYTLPNRSQHFGQT